MRSLAVVLALIAGIFLSHHPAQAQTPTNCGTTSHTIGATEACSKIFPVSGTCGNRSATPYGGDVEWYTFPWESVSITLVEVDYDILIQGPAGVTYYASAFVGNTWTPDPMTRYAEVVSFPSQNSGGQWGGVILSTKSDGHGAQFPSNADTTGQHLDMHLDCYYSTGGVNYNPAFNGTIRVVYYLNPT